jgi:hypothetical protein
MGLAIGLEDRFAWKELSQLNDVRMTWQGGGYQCFDGS